MNKTTKKNKEKKNELFFSFHEKLFELYDKTYYALKNFQFDSQVQSKTLFFRIFRVLLAIFIIVFGIKLILNKNTSVNSLQGFINGRVVSLSSPIEGKLNYFVDMTPGVFIRKNQKIAQVTSQHEKLITDLEIKIHESDSKILAIKKHIELLNKLLEERVNEYKNAKRKSNIHKNIRIKFEKEKLEETRAELEEVKSKKFIADQESVRMSELYKDGFVSQADYEEAIEKAKQSIKQVNSKRHQLEQTKSQLIAASHGLQINGALTANYHESQKKMIEKELLELKQEISKNSLNLKLTEAENKKLKEELSKQQVNTITSPVNGVVWTVSSKEQEFINQYDPIVKIVDCNDRWVEAFIPEQDFSTLYVGAPVTIKSLNADKTTWTGYIRAIRSGDSRVKVGNDLDIFPPELIRKQVVLKIEVNWRKEDSDFITNSSEFCRTGGSVEVQFERKSLAKNDYLR
ncbi:MAG: HlyD family efflux transporter periplasmic adaptor subunit [Candidatus Caenarcaniphilales bacterium]|nr:HlyD family efflux transporter periplasmic adaptor subunit [Candidatus Caenarcaniphilales bacterium]